MRPKAEGWGRHELHPVLLVCRNCRPQKTTGREAATPAWRRVPTAP